MKIIADEVKLNQDALAQLLIGRIEALNLENVFVYYNFPFYRGETAEDLIQAHVLFVSKDYGVIFFRCLQQESSFTEIEKNKLDALDSHIFGKINKQDALRKQRRELKINLTPAIFVPEERPQNSSFLGPGGIKTLINSNAKEKLTEDEFSVLIAAIEGTINLKLKKDRSTSEKMSKGKILSLIQSKEAVFDYGQKRAALNIIDSPQRIRGLAGSGKTIILTMKAALYHLQNPEAEILYTYFTKALYGQVKYLIEKYYRDFSENREPNWKKIHVWHGWGGKGLNGVYSDTCFDNQIPALDLTTARRRAAKDQDAFDYACEDLNKNKLKQKFDLTLIDEGQDFPKHFYRVCYKITKNARLVWAYDDFQNIFDVDIQSEKETFGRNEKGELFVDFSKQVNKLQDIVLYKCYRNPRYALLSAFALGLGIYNKPVLQRLENNKHWEDLGFAVEKGESKDNEEMVISRPETNSPSETNKYFASDSIAIKVFEEITAECNFVIDAIANDVHQEQLRPDDICVISLDSRNIGNYFSRIQNGLASRGIKVWNLLDAPQNNTFFSIDNHVTLSTINKAKGNETGMVYIVGLDAIFVNKNNILDRNKLFTAITRSKGWVMMTGYQQAEQCKLEMDKLKGNGYKLNFVQPSKKDTRMILRDVTEQQDFLNQVSKLIESFGKNSGLSEDQIRQLIASQNATKK